MRAYYYDVNSAKKLEAIAGGGENLKDLRHTYSDRQSALRAARSELNRLQRGAATLTYTLVKGQPFLIPELTYSLQGVKSEIDEIIWYGGNLEHRLTPDSGYLVRLELESKQPEDCISGLIEDNIDKPVKYTGTIAFYRDTVTGLEKAVTAGDQSKPQRLQRVYINERNARRAALREWQRIQKAVQ